MGGKADKRWGVRDRSPVQSPCTHGRNCGCALGSASSPAQCLMHAALAFHGHGPGSFGIRADPRFDSFARRCRPMPVTLTTPPCAPHLNLGQTNMARLSDSSTHPSFDNLAPNLTTRQEATATPPPLGRHRSTPLSPTCITTALSHLCATYASHLIP